jgi:hypothetical protein
MMLGEMGRVREGHRVLSRPFTDGPVAEAALAQPSGLALFGHLFVLRRQ